MSVGDSNYILYILLGIICTFIFWLWAASVNRRRRTLMKRDSIPIEELVQLLCANSNLTLQKQTMTAWIKTSSALEIPPDKLRATDRWTKELRLDLILPEGLNDGMDALLNWIHNQYQEDLSLEDYPTFGEFVIKLATIFQQHEKNYSTG